MWAAFTVIVLVAAVQGYPSGAPESRCDDPRPKHPGSEEIAADKITHLQLKQSARDFKNGDVIEVTLVSTGAPFKGFLVKAFVDNGNEVGGQFLPGEGVKVITKCSAITHNNNNPKQEVVLKWKADIAQGTVHFKATVVENVKKYYIGLESH
ncbi:putative ferric-chelate reductase 1 homolog [Ornithodoros turicata]|uniref:putative ferric-chelate reductase 1 homolog n=1 Tax=Ornithodoros turicata TaxID=34597 RepID=UPI0031386AAE